MIPFIIIAALLLLAGLWLAVVRAPFGHQDETGWHEGVSPEDQAVLDRWLDKEGE